MSPLSDILLHINLFVAEDNICKFLVRDGLALVLINGSINVQDLVGVHVDFLLEHTLGKLFKVQLSVTIFVVHFKGVDDLLGSSGLPKFTDNGVEALVKGLRFALHYCSLNLLLLDLEQAFLFLLKGSLAL